MFMRFTFTFVFILLMLTACKETSKPPTLTLQERDSIKTDLTTRANYKSSNAITITDTSAAYYKDITVYDTRFKDSIANDVNTFYHRNNFKTRWLYSEKNTALFDSYLKVLEQSVYYGLNPETYRYSELKAAVKKLYHGTPTDSAIAVLDKNITASYFLLAKHIVQGRILNPSEGKKIWLNNIQNEDDINLLLRVTDDEALEKTIETLHPSNRYYNKMRQKLQELVLVKKEDYEQFSFDKPKAFKLGYKDKKVRLIRENLEKRGYIFLQDSIKDTVDEELIETLKYFQKEKGLEEDGIPGERTLYYLNMTNEHKRELLIVNMERMRWLNKDFGKEYIIVNIPQFMLYAYNNDTLDFSMRVIVGKGFNPTPIFMDKMEYIEFRPTWTVPQSIIRDEMIPLMAKDPTRYTRKGFSIYKDGKKINPYTIDWSNEEAKKQRYTFIERPSAANALGLVKFIFPNSLDIYLHDTPTDHLFEKKYRAFSHGCVRVEKPAEFAAYLLRDKEGWDLDRVLEAMYNGPYKQRVHLDQDLLVQLLYITVYIDENDELVIFNDIYDFDKSQIAKLKNDYGFAL